MRIQPDRLFRITRYGGGGLLTVLLVVLPFSSGEAIEINVGSVVIALVYVSSLLVLVWQIAITPTLGVKLESDHIEIRNEWRRVSFRRADVVGVSNATSGFPWFHCHFVVDTVDGGWEVRCIGSRFGLGERYLSEAEASVARWASS